MIEETAQPNSLALSEAADADITEAAVPAHEVAESAAVEERGGSDAAASVPDNWRDMLAGGDAKLRHRLDRFASPAALGKSWLAAQQKITSGEVRRARPEGDTGDAQYHQALESWRVRAGVPATPQGYLDNLPLGRVVGEADQPLIDEFLTEMHAADAPAQYIHAALGWYYDLIERQLAKRADNDLAQLDESEAEMRAQWGSDYAPNLNAVHSLFAVHGPEGLLDKIIDARLPDGRTLGNHADTIRFFVALARQLNPRGTVAPSNAKTALKSIQEEKAALQAEQADTDGPYWKGPDANAKQARYRELLALEEGHRKGG